MFCQSYPTQMHAANNSRVQSPGNNDHNLLTSKCTFRGELVNAENIGKTGDDLVAQWNTEHPDGPVEG